MSQKEALKDNISKVNESWEDYLIVWCSDTKRDITLQCRAIERFKKTGQIRALDIRCQFPCGKSCYYNKIKQ